jgi:hypothetical protein
MRCADVTYVRMPRIERGSFLKKAAQKLFITLGHGLVPDDARGPA